MPHAPPFEQVRHPLAAVSAQLMPTFCASQGQKVEVPAEVQVQLPVLTQDGEHTGPTAVAQAMSIQTAVHVHTPAVPSAFQDMDVPPLAQAGVQTTGLVVLQEEPDHAAGHAQAATVPAAFHAQTPPCEHPL